MLSYRHAYHAGNSADVLKHIVLSRALDLMQRKPTPLVYFDSHAGAGAYELDGTELANREHRAGISRLWPQLGDAPAELAMWRAAIQASQVKLSAQTYSPQHYPKHYPGSPAIAVEQLRAQDRAILCELHPSDHAILNENFAADRRVQVHKRDGVAALAKLLPVKGISRGLVLIDPSWEIRSDYLEIPKAIAELRKQFRAAVIMLWYPLLADERHLEMLATLAQLPGEQMLVELETEPTRDAGMYGSGLWLMQAPWGLEPELEALLPWLTEKLNEPGAEPTAWRIEKIGD